MSEWRKHDGGPNPAPGMTVDLRLGLGVVEDQPSSRVNWSLKWTWKPSDSTSPSCSGEAIAAGLPGRKS